MKLEDSDFLVYQFNNTLPNFFTRLAVPAFLAKGDGNLTGTEVQQWLSETFKTRQQYRDATTVLTYEHDPEGYVKSVRP